MGCLSSKIPKSQIKSLSQIKMIPVKYEGIGVLKASFQSVVELTNCERFFSKNQTFLQIGVCNQKFRTKLAYDTITKNKFNPGKNQFEFFINQVDVQKSLEVKIFCPASGFNKFKKTAWGKEILKEKCFQPKDDEESYKQSCNIHLTSENDEKVGWIRVSLQFIPKKYDILMSRVNSVTLRNQSKQGRSIYFNIKIGGQQFESQSKRSTERSIPQWQNSLHHFVVPESLKFGKLSIYGKDQHGDFDYLVGQLKFDLRVILESDQLQTFAQPITLKKKVTGTVCIQFLKTKDMIPQIQKVQRPKRIKYIQDEQLEIALKNPHQKQNYFSKKTSQATTASTSKQSFNNAFQNRLNKKLQELRNSNVSIPLLTANESSQQYQVGQYQQRERNEFEIDHQQRKGAFMKKQDSQYVCDRTFGQRVLSDPQLSFQVDIPETSSKLIERNQAQVQKDTNLRTSRASRRSSSRKSSVNNKKQSNIKVQYDSLLYSKGSRARINILQLQKQSNEQKIQHHIKLRSKIAFVEQQKQRMDLNSYRFDSLPDDISSKSVCQKNRSILQKCSQNKSQIFSSSLNENSNSSEKNDHFSNQIKAMEDKNIQILEKHIQNISFHKKQQLKKVQQICNEQNFIKRQDQNFQQTESNNYDDDDFSIKLVLSSLITKKRVTTNS